MKIIIIVLIAVFSCTCTSSSNFDVTYLDLTLSESVVIKSPGYPKNYKTGSYKKWHVNSYGITENISIQINMDINEYSSSSCLDYLQIQEINPSTGNSTIFNECGEKEINITSKEHRLWIKFVSNNDNFTSKGFELILKGVSSINEENEQLNLYLSQELIIPSQNVRYETGKIYKWLVVAPSNAEVIFIKIKMDISKPNYGQCEDFLQIMEVNPLSKNFKVFSQCGKMEENRTAKGNRLLIKLVLNNVKLPSTEIELKLKVIKVRATTSISLTSTTIDLISLETSQLGSSSTTTKPTVVLTTPETSTERPTTFISLTPVKRKTTTDPSLLTPSTTKPTTLLSTTETSAGKSHVTTMDATTDAISISLDISTGLI